MAGNRGKYGRRKVREGTVVSDKMQKTIVVAVEEHVKHRLYKKRVKRVHKFMAHDEGETAKLGDRVRIIESRPVSRNKRWALVDVMQRVELPEVAAESIDLDLLGEVKPALSDAEVPAADAEEAAVAEGAIAEPAAMEEPVLAEVVTPEPEVAEIEAETEAPGEVEVEEIAAEPEPVAVESAAEAEPEPVVAAEPAAESEPELLVEGNVAEPVEAQAFAPEEAPAEAAEVTEPVEKEDAG